ncbi:antitoxin [Azoarcus sp. DN11]|uniref:AbrB/MazE/SpoVT family DNA-binding domain-containing protein n=1 Tax=Azoarcus sp. DN11 TaxID=356837 RepID=UPI000EF2B6B0|nr:antitoxin [Azoarcus sp. DN11]AYH41795.1 hypothetical protein CDA09_00065 [Azoarcus sp. DN11]
MARKARKPIHTTNLRKVGVSVDDGELIVERQRPRYTLEELLAQCDGSAEESTEDREWLDTEPVGRELL